MNFSLKTKKSNISEIQLTERYPQKGFVFNKTSEMVVYVLKGRVTLNLNKRNSLLKKGSVVLVKTNQKYYWIPKPSVTLLIFSTPPWKVRQQRVVL